VPGASTLGKPIKAAIEQRNEDAECHPKNNRKRRKLGRVDQIGNDGDHGRTTDKRPPPLCTENGFHVAGRRLGGMGVC